MTEVRDHDFAVLFVDDEEKSLKYFRLAFGKELRVLTAGNVPEALELLEKEAEHIGVLITDQRMPGQQGVELLNRAREEWPDIVRMLTTAYTDLEDAIEAVNRGEITRYVTKPWDLQALRGELNHAMDFFLLRRERDRLLAEKVSVRARLALADRLRSMIAIGAGCSQLRHAPHALAAWIEDATGFGIGNDAGIAELWSMEVAETAALSRLSRWLHDLDRTQVAGFSEHVRVGERLGGATGDAAGMEVAAQASSLDLLLATLREHCDDWTIEASGDQAGLHAGASTRRVDATFYGPSLPTEDAPLAWMHAYLIAFHHGGHLRCRPGEQGASVELMLPLDPAVTRLPEPDDVWLDERFCGFEDWG